MARKALSYGVLNIGGEQRESPRASETVERTGQSPSPPELQPNHPEAHLVKQRAQQVMIYMRPEAHKALNRYALEQTTFRNKIKPHDLLVEAVQEWFDKHGLRERVRVEPERGRRA